MTTPTEDDVTSTDPLRPVAVSCPSATSHQPTTQPASAEATTERLRAAEALLGVGVCRRLGIYPLPDGFLLSVVIPVFNEVATIGEVVRRVRAVDVPAEIIVVDDASTDGTSEVLKELALSTDLTLLRHRVNQGKGSALRTGFAVARGDIVLVQDADLEYDPSDFLRLIQPIVEGRADVVFGNRFAGGNRRVMHFWHYLGNRCLTLLSNLFTNLNLSDIETGYKVFRAEVLRAIAPTLRETRFGIEPELTAKIARLPGVRIEECPISYAGRSYAQGKKIGMSDALRAVWCVLRY